MSDVTDEAADWDGDLYGMTLGVAAHRDKLAAENASLRAAVDNLRIELTEQLGVVNELTVLFARMGDPDDLLYIPHPRVKRVVASARALVARADHDIASLLGETP